MSHHSNRLRPTLSAREANSPPAVDELAELEAAGTFEPVPPPKKPAAKKPTKKAASKKARR